MACAVQIERRMEVLGALTSGWSKRAESAPTAIERLLLDAVMNAIGRPPLDVRLWDGRSAWRSERTTIASLGFGDRSTLWRFLVRPDSGFAEAYVEGKLEIAGDLPGLFASMPRSSEASSPWPSLRGSFEDDRVGVEATQLAEFDRICRKLDLRPEQRVIEVGCGWGSLALHAAEHFGVYVHAFDVGGERLRFAREQVRARGLEHRVEFIEDDPRNAREEYDAFLAVGMLEHVGGARVRELIRISDRWLAPGGRGLLDFVAQAKPSPALAEVLGQLEPFDMAVIELDNLQQHCATTLEQWWRRLDARPSEALDDRQARARRIALASAMAAFRVGASRLYRVVFARADRLER